VTRVYIDIETRSRCNLVKQGVYRYAEDPSTEILCIAWAVNDEPVKLWNQWDEYCDDLDELAELMHRQGVTLSAYNANFERVVLNSHAGQSLGLPVTCIDQWTCTAVQAALHALPRALGDCAKALRTRPKSEAGKKVMMALCKPRTAGKMKGVFWEYEDRPEDFHILGEYNIDDVEAERSIARYLPALPRSEQAMWELDQKINDRGIKVDLDLATFITETWPQVKERLNEECLKLTGDIGVTQVGLLTKWLGLSNLRADTVKKELAKNRLSRKKMRVLELRAEASKTSVTKFNTLMGAVCMDGRLRGMFLFHGAQTGRWTGRIVQLHNLPRNTSKHPEEQIAELYQDPGLLSGDLAQQLIRPTFTGESDGLLIGDFKSIELCFSLWLVGDQVGIDKINDGVDMYKDMAQFIYHIPYEDIDSMKRFVGKQAVLGLGYGMGPPKFVEYCLGFGEHLDLELAEHTVSAYRDLYIKITHGWVECNKAAVKAVRNPGTSVEVFGGKIKYIVRGNFLYCVLPSGRPIAYPFPEVHQKEVPWGGTRPSLTFMSVDQYTRKWQRGSTFGGRLFENICQGGSSCLLRYSLQQVDKHYIIVGHVHDEGLAEGPGENLRHFTRLMERTPPWADGLPVVVESVHSPRYLKA
jgi:DNA polymerase